MLKKVVEKVKSNWLLKWSLIIIFSLIIIIIFFPDISSKPMKLESLNEPIELEPLLKPVYEETTYYFTGSIYADLCRLASIMNYTNISYNDITCFYNSTTNYCLCLEELRS